MNRVHVACLATVAVAAGALACACGDRVQAGLANAPSLERQSEPRRGYDVITGGDEGCTSIDGGPSRAAATGGCKGTPLGIGAADAASGSQFLQ